MLLPLGSLALLALTLGTVLSSSAAAGTLGYDYTCYEGAARHLVNGQPIYDTVFSVTVGTCPGTYTYPPAFAVALVPWLNLGGAAAGLWCVAMAACFLAGVALLPVRRDIRWLVVILGAVDWPLLNAVKLGQVEPLLFLGFAAAWRWMERPVVVGVTTAIGALVKVQPALLGVWALATRRYRAAAVAVAVALPLAGAATLITGIGAWTAYFGLLRELSGTYSTGANSAPGAVAYLAGLPEWADTAVQLASEALAAAALLAAWRWASPAASLQVTIVVSQLLSSPLRDHYAVVLLLPVAWLVGRGRTWVAFIPLVAWLYTYTAVDERAWPAVASIPITFFGVLAVLLWEARRERREMGRGSADGGGVAADAGVSAGAQAVGQLPI